MLSLSFSLCDPLFFRRSGAGKRKASTVRLMKTMAIDFLFDPNGRGVGTWCALHVHIVDAWCGVHGRQQHVNSFSGNARPHHADVCHGAHMACTTA